MSRKATRSGVDGAMYAEPIGEVRIVGSELGVAPPAMRQKGQGVARSSQSLDLSILD